MWNARLRVFLLTLCLTSTGIALNARVEAEEAPTAKVSGTALTLGRVTTNPKKYVPGLEALGRYLVARLGDMGITENRVVLARDNEHMIELLRRREVDLVSETPFTALTFEKKVSAEILLREWKKGVSSYHTVFFTRKDSAIQSLQDLVGKTVAFEDPGSTSAYFVPTYGKMMYSQLITPKMRGYWIRNQGQEDYELALKNYTSWINTLEGKGYIPETS